MAGIDKLRLGILVSGSGTNMEAIAVECEEGRLPAEVAVVISNRSDAYALKRAERHGIKSVFVDPSSYPSREAYDRAVVKILKEHQVDLVILAGYMLLVGRAVLDSFPMRIMNIHPALLPSFPGTSGIDDALEYGVKVTGVTVHFVDEGLDTGPIILQEAVAIKEDDDRESLAERIHRVEHKLYPRAIKYFAQGRLSLDGRRVRIREDCFIWAPTTSRGGRGV